MAKKDEILSRFYKVDQTAALIGVSRNTLNLWESQGLFPKKIRLGPGRVAFSRESVERWIVEKKMEAEAAAATV